MLPRGLRPPGDLPGRLRLRGPAVACERRFTDEQAAAIARREGDLLLDAGAGSGKTTVLVERFACAVLHDGVEASAILTITFTEKAAAELRERIRRRLAAEGELEAARATEAAPISTIHAFCARLLRGHALAAGLDPRFSVMDRPAAAAVAGKAMDEAIEELAATPQGRRLIATYGAGPLRSAVLELHGRLRSEGQAHPRLPPLPPPGELPAARTRLTQAASRAASQLGELEAPGVRVVRALECLEACRRLSARGDGVPWPGELEALLFGNGHSALGGEACRAYREALGDFRRVCAEHHAAEPHRLVDGLLDGFARAYASLKREAGGVDFEDLELLALRVLRARPELAEELRERFTHVMVDEFQDTNHVQLELISLLCRGNLFTVGDAQQSIYGFRHADVELFRRRSRELAARGQRLTLRTNFRSSPAVLEVIGRAFGAELGEIHMPLQPGRLDAADPAPGSPSGASPRVELLVCEKGAEWEDDGSATPWRLAEARLLAARIGELLEEGASPRQVTVLMRATTDMRVYERALEALAIPSYVIGGRGYWGHPQVVDAVAYLRALANPLDGEALLGTLASPFVGLSLDALVILCDAARARGVELGAWLSQAGELAALAEPDRARLTCFLDWFPGERRAVARRAVDELLDRALTRSGYELAMLALPGGRRRLANVRKLMRLAREHEAQAGPDLPGFLELVRGREGGWIPDAQESEAPVEGEALDAVRLMTIHRAKGLEFDITCVADLGRAPWSHAPLVRLGTGTDRRIGMAIARLGEPGREYAFAYGELGEEAAAAEAREERRLFYVAATRARERLILSGAARFEPWKRTGSAMAWLAPAFLGAGEAEGERIEDLVAERSGERLGVAFRFLTAAEEEGAAGGAAAWAGGAAAWAGGAAAWAGGAALTVSTSPRGGPPVAVQCGSCDESPEKRAFLRTAPEGPPVVRRLSYSALAEYHRCGYRFYAERLLGLPALEAPSGGSSALEAPSGGSWTPSARSSQGRPGAAEPRPGAAEPRPGAAERGMLLHAVLEELDFRRPVPPARDRVQALAGRPLGPAEHDEIDALVERFAVAPLCRRLAAAREVRREERFAMLVDGILFTGALDVLARERDGTLLIVDYKSDRLGELDPQEVVEDRYGIQQLVYGLAALRTGARRAEVAHVFLERPDRPVRDEHDAGSQKALQAELERLTEGIRSGRYEVTFSPHREVCAGCPVEASLCSWPLSMTRRGSVEQLF
jgi:ATP-dependent helicase/nuclease subunit A